jgi:hypothetical protein
MTFASMHAPLPPLHGYGKIIMEPGGDTSATGLQAGLQQWRQGRLSADETTTSHLHLHQQQERRASWGRTRSIGRPAACVCGKNKPWSSG